MQKQVTTIQVKRCNYYLGNLISRKRTLPDPQMPSRVPSQPYTLLSLLEKSSLISIAFRRRVDLAGCFQKWKFSVTCRDPSYSYSVMSSKVEVNMSTLLFGSLI